MNGHCDERVGSTPGVTSIPHLDSLTRMPASVATGSNRHEHSGRTLCPPSIRSSLLPSPPYSLASITTLFSDRPVVSKSDFESFELPDITVDQVAYAG